MKIRMNFVGMIILLLSASSSIKSQSTEICSKLKFGINAQASNMTIRRFTSDENDCEINFSYRGGWVSIYSSRFDSVKSARKQFRKEFDYLTLAEANPDGVRMLSKFGFWNDSRGYTSDSREELNHLYLLRRKNIVVTILASNYEFLSVFEERIRGISRNK